MFEEKKKSEDTYIFDFSAMLNSQQPSLDLSDIFYMQEYVKRKQFLTAEINSGSVEDVCKAIMHYNEEDNGVDPAKRKPILLYLDTFGGETTAGFKLIDVIQSSKTPVYVINQCTCYSMGFLIYIVGHKRFASKSATFLMHDGSIQLGDSGSKTRDYMRFDEEVEKRTKDMVLEKTGITAEMYDSKMREEWYMFADEAKELGIVDSIIGVDCELDDVI